MTEVVKLSSLQIDTKREIEGDDVPSSLIPGVTLRVSALTKPSYRIKRDALVMRLDRIHKGNIPPEVMTTEFGRLYAEEILHGWSGLDEAYSKELAIERLTDWGYRILVRAVEYAAQSLSEPNMEFVEEAAKNSARPSAGS